MRNYQIIISLLAVMACQVVHAAQAPAAARSSSAFNWPMPALPKRFPVEQIRSYPLRLAASGELADVYYPAPRRVSRRLHRDSFPLIVMLQGALVDKEYYSQFAQGVARFGFVVVVPNHSSSVLSGAALFTEASVITDVLATMQAQDAIADSPVYKIIDTSRMGLAGHSFGGVTGLLAAANVCTFPFCNTTTGFQRPAELQAAALTGTYLGIDVDTTGVPIALLGGDQDIGLPQFRETLENLEPPRALIVVPGANHFGLCDTGAPPGAQINPAESPQELPQAITAAQFAHWTGLFLRAHLHRDPVAQRLIYRSRGDEAVEIIATP
jgi:dienelactone hydrolase